MKIFATDLDGTLLKKGGIIDESIVKGINELKNNNYRVLAVSGRVSSSIRYFTNKLGVKDYIIANNGAIILDEKDNIIKDWALSNSDLEKIFDLADKYNIDIRMYSKDTYFDRNLDFNQIKHMYISKNKYAVNINIRDDIKDYVIKNNIKIYKVLLDTRQSNYDEFYKELKNNSDLELTYSGKINLDIMKKNVSKSKALEYLKNYFEKNDLKVEQIVAIGDYYNDIDMIKLADIGIAMGNGCDKLKNNADLITDTNDNNGFLKAIENIL